VLVRNNSLWLLTPDTANTAETTSHTLTLHPPSNATSFFCAEGDNVTVCIDTHVTATDVLLSECQITDSSWLVSSITTGRVAADATDVIDWTRPGSTCRLSYPPIPTTVTVTLPLQDLIDDKDTARTGEMWLDGSQPITGTVSFLVDMTDVYHCEFVASDRSSDVNCTLA
jgi:hypothetical protein